MSKAIPGEKISIVTDEISQDPSDVETFLNEHELNTLEIRMMGHMRVPYIRDFLWEILKKQVRENNWTVLSLSPGTFKGHFTDQEKIEHELNTVLALTIEKAQDINAGNIITFGFMADPEDQIPEYVVETLRKATDMCSYSGINLLLENEPGSFADTGERTRLLIDKVNHPNLFVNWDPCNSGIFWNPDRLAKCVNLLGGKIRHVHVKDAIPVDGKIFPEYTTISEGTIGWKGHVESLKGIHYDGYFGIETHFEPLIDNSAKILDELRSIMTELNYWER